MTTEKSMRREENNGKYRKRNEKKPGKMKKSERGEK